MKPQQLQSFLSILWEQLFYESQYDFDENLLNVVDITFQFNIEKVEYFGGFNKFLFFQICGKV